MTIRTISIAICAIILVAGIAGVNYAADNHKYVGASMCKGCHSSDKMGGTQFTSWTESKHSKAFENLGTDAAKEVAAKAGVEGNPQEAAACLKCHVAGYEAPAEEHEKTWKQEEGVTCEACHGPGKDYMPMATMKDDAAAVAAGLLIPDEKTCVKCHNDTSPTWTSFDYAEYSAKIKHWESEESEAGKG